MTFAIVGALTLGASVAAFTTTLSPRYRAVRTIDVQTTPELVRAASFAFDELPYSTGLHDDVEVVLDRDSRFPNAHEWRWTRSRVLRRVPRKAHASLRIERFHPLTNAPTDDDLRVIAEARSAYAASRLARAAAARLVVERRRRIRRVLRAAHDELRARAALADKVRSARLTSRASLVQAAIKGRVSNLGLTAGSPATVSRISPSPARDTALAAVLGGIFGALAGAFLWRRRSKSGDGG